MEKNLVILIIDKETCVTSKLAKVFSSKLQNSKYDKSFQYNTYHINISYVPID